MDLLKHSNNVKELSILIGMCLNLKEERLNDLSIAALLHDIGKLQVPYEILYKPYYLTKDEFDIMKKHTVYGYEFLKTNNLNIDIINAVLHHHERYDGSGYPEALKGEKIPLYSKIITIADSFDAMTSERTYKVPFSFEKALEEIYLNRNSQFDPFLVDIFINKMLSNKVTLN